MRYAWMVLAAALAAHAAEMESRRLEADAVVNLDPASSLWSAARPVYVERGRWGEAAPGRRTEVRSRWTERNLYLLFVCPYRRLHLKPAPSSTVETDHLWDWDVAEAFIGTDFRHIGHYTEYEVSPQGEWVDLDIDRDHPGAQGGIAWNSGFAARARIDRAKSVWFAAMRIPMQAIGIQNAARGGKMRINLYRIEGPPPERTYLTWQPTNSETFHVPESFGTLTLVDQKR
jgi:cellulose/xylan binding protein with CBM9 domain